METTLNPFGQEDVKHIKASFFKTPFRSNEERWNALIDAIYFNKDCPQNKNVLIHGQECLVWNGHVWEEKDLGDILDAMMQSAKKVIRTYLVCASLAKQSSRDVNNIEDA